MIAANDTLAPGQYRRLEIPRMTQEQSHAFLEMQRGRDLAAHVRRSKQQIKQSPTALWIAGNLAGEQPRFWGDNKGGWPVLFGLTQKWDWNRAEKIKAGLQDAYYERDLLARYWFNTYEEADRVQCAFYQGMRSNFEDALGKYLSFDPEVRLPAIDSAIRGHAASMRFEIWNDKEFLEHLTWLLAAARAYAQRHGYEL